MLCQNVTADINGHLLANVVVVHNFFVCHLVFWTLKIQDENIHLISGPVLDQWTTVWILKLSV